MVVSSLSPSSTRRLPEEVHSAMGQVTDISLTPEFYFLNWWPSIRICQRHKLAPS
jgi:hypothetical protein